MVRLSTLAKGEAEWEASTVLDNGERQRGPMNGFSSSSETAGGRLVEMEQAAKSFSPYLDQISMPNPQDWDQPGSAVTAWLGIHLAVSVVFVFGSMSYIRSVAAWQTFLLMLWLGCLSVFAVRVAVELAESTRLERRFDLSLFDGPKKYLGANARQGTVMTLTAICLLPADWTLRLVLLSTGAMILGARVAGLDAWAGKQRPAFFYIRAVFSVSGVAIAVTVATAILVLLALLAVSIDPLVGPEAMNESARLFGDQSFSRPGQAAGIFLVSGLVILPVLLVCETIAALDRYETRLNDLLAQTVLRTERSLNARGIHNQALSLVALLRMQVRDNPRIAPVVDELDERLRDLHFGFLASSEFVDLPTCIRQALEFSRRHGPPLAFTTDDGASQLEVIGPLADVIQAYAVCCIQNAAKAGATSSSLEFCRSGGLLIATFWDNGGGFNPIEAIASGGELARVQRLANEIGGGLDFTVDRSTTSVHLIVTLEGLS